MIGNNYITLPSWLDDYIFNHLGASYQRFNSDMLAINYGKKETLQYLGTYFPRSYSESYTIFSQYFSIYSKIYTDKSELNIFDFGCGTGGELMGLTSAIRERIPNVNTINIHAFDGNQYALRIMEQIVAYCQGIYSTPKINTRIAPFRIDDFYDLSLFQEECLSETNKYDIILTFKAICELVTKQQFETKNPYAHIINTFAPYLTENGIMCIADITSHSDISQEWLPKMLDRGISATTCNVLMQNKDFSESYYITHSRKQNELTKIAWRILKPRLS